MFSKIKFLISFTICIFAILNLSPLLGNSHDCAQYSQPEYSGIVVDGKYYIAPGSVYVGPTGIYININGNFVSVLNLQVDEHGVYVADVVGVCPHCRWPTIGGVCLNPDCPTKG